ncbi:hypothetical protein BD65_2908 [Yersinia ruckeri]|uniref:hypothetical protein n=1 Tax=Yersinia ruckeri TaxID=29486 RepID=UPI0005ABC4DF|nr:hypothetical protein [Yersinia ruckeri]AJI95074.1 hypothetical protein BD65_2908 [Yersinia ruckeri]MCW6567717.1 hypothetical protein [Yersinia ruckeri]
MKKIIMATLVIILALAISFGYSFYKNAPSLDDRIDCYAQVSYEYVVSGQRSHVNTGIYFHLSKGRGMVDYSGEMTIDDKKFKLKRYAEINYNEKDSSINSLKTVKLYIMPIDNVPPDIAQKYLYPYLTREGGWVNFGVYPNANNGYVFSTTAIPQFLCKKL